MIAAEQGLADMVKALLAAGADPDSRHEVWTLQHYSLIVILNHTMKSFWTCKASWYGIMHMQHPI